MLRHATRAPRACSWCRERKVRCDASIQGCPCTRCWQDGRSDCFLRSKADRRSKARSRRLQTPGGIIGDSPVEFDASEHGSLSRTVDFSRNGDAGFSPTTSSHPVQPATQNHEAEYPSNIDYSSFHFLELHGLGFLVPEDAIFLSAKGCLKLPDRDAIDDFVKQYFLHVHPIVPVLDEAEFWRMYEQHGSSSEPGLRKLSLFVFQAMLFASCPYVSLDTIKACGFSDKRNARNILYARAKLLFTLKAEDRPLSRAQGAVLLTHHASAKEPQAYSRWLSHAIQNTMVLGRRPVPPWHDANEASKKRLWWSILLRDMSMSVGLRRSSQITAQHFNTKADCLEEADFANEIANSRVYSQGEKRLLFKVFQDQCRLAILFTEMVCFIFSSSGLSNPSLSSEGFQAALSRIRTTKDRLVQWKENSQVPPPGTVSDNPESANIFTNITYMYYYSTQIDIAHYEALLLANHSAFAGDSYMEIFLENGRSLKDAMGGLTTIMEDLSVNKSGRIRPLRDLAYLTMPLVISVMNFKLSSSHSEMTTRRHQLDSLAEIIRQSSSIYDVTDFYSQRTNHILRLVYKTSNHLFLQGNAHAKPLLQHPEPAHGDDCIESRLSSVNTVGFLQKDRPTSWHDAFLMYPLAYLRISTTVDYSLAMGCLPQDNALTQLVRYIPTSGMGVKQPWASNNLVVTHSEPATVDWGHRKSTDAEEVTDCGNLPLGLKITTEKGQAQFREDICDMVQGGDGEITLPLQSLLENASSGASPYSSQARRYSQSCRQGYRNINLNFLDLRKPSPRSSIEPVHNIKKSHLNGSIGNGLVGSPGSEGLVSSCHETPTTTPTSDSLGTITEATWNSFDLLLGEFFGT